jgi:hypothetical protein
VQAPHAARSGYRSPGGYFPEVSLIQNDPWRSTITRRGGDSATPRPDWGGGQPHPEDADAIAFSRRRRRRFGHENAVFASERRWFRACTEPTSTPEDSSARFRGKVSRARAAAGAGRGPGKRSRKALSLPRRSRGKRSRSGTRASASWESPRAQLMTRAVGDDSSTRSTPVTTVHRLLNVTTSTPSP